MLDFKKLLAEDIDAVFLDDDIFAEEHTINGQKMKAVISNDTLKERRGTLARNRKSEIPFR